MTQIETICHEMGDFAKDTKLNMENILSENGSPDLSQRQIYAIALSCAYSTESTKLVKAILCDAKKILSNEEIFAAKSAASIMAMNNVYYRFLHFVSDHEMFNMPTNLRMQVIDKSGVSKVDFELYSLAVSVLSGCGLCIKSHKSSLEKHRISKLAIQSVVRIASVINSCSNSLSINEIDKNV